MNWVDFHEAAPDLAAAAEKLFDSSGVVLVGSVRRDGSPRISPVEPLLTEGELYLGMMPRSVKVVDLRKDPRVCLHSSVADREAIEEVKLHGRVREVDDAGEREAYCKSLEAKIGWSPEGMEFALFAVEIESAAHFRADGDHRLATRFRAGDGVDRFRQGVEGGVEETL